ncbi:MAG: SOS response-associated peptidase [Sphingomonadaceae bacterium]
MCQLYRLDTAAGAIANLFRADPAIDPWDGGYVAQGKFAPVVVQGKEGRRLVPRQWGVPPPRNVDRPVVNVRNLESPFWIGTLRHTEFRCLVPVTSFMEWGGIKGKRIQHWFTLPAAPVFAFAGIWRDSEVPSFAFLTCEPNRLVGAVHPKAMPLILHPEDYETWLNADWKDAQALVAPFPSQLMIADPMPALPGAAPLL